MTLQQIDAPLRQKRLGDGQFQRRLVQMVALQEARQRAVGVEQKTAAARRVERAVEQRVQQFDGGGQAQPAAAKQCHLAFQHRVEPPDYGTARRQFDQVVAVKEPVWPLIGFKRCVYQPHQIACQAHEQTLRGTRSRATCRAAVDLCAPIVKDGATAVQEGTPRVVVCHGFGWTRLHMRGQAL